MPQDGRTSSRMPQTITLASRCFTGPRFDNLIERFIRVVLAILILDVQLPIAGPCPIDRARKHRINEKLVDPERRSGRCDPGSGCRSGKIAREGRTSSMLWAISPASSFDREDRWASTVVPKKTKLPARSRQLSPDVKVAPEHVVQVAQPRRLPGLPGKRTSS